MLDVIESAVKRLRDKGVPAADVVTAVRKLVHSPLVAALAQATPNKVDDSALEILKVLFPPA